MEAKQIAQQLRKDGRLSKMDIQVPIRYKLIGRTDSTGAASPHRVLDLMKAINAGFASDGFKFYLANSDGMPWDNYYDDEFYSNSGEQGVLFTNFRSSDAVSIFVPDDATPPGSSGLGVTLGYYSPSRDILVFRRSEVGIDASTALHELGHYFSLPHTFRGWDCCFWNGLTSEDCADPEITSPVTDLFSPCQQNTRVELVTRGEGANCDVAGDTFCDTQADYNFGFGWPSCEYAGGVRDRNEELLNPDEDNYMGYFLGCQPYQFSGEQVDAMLGNYNSGSRDFLRQSTPDVLDSITAEIEYVFPVDRSTIDSADQVTIDWEDVPNAMWYYVELSRQSSFTNLVASEIVTKSNVTFTGL